jgi:hypothetical protein
MCQSCGAAILWRKNVKSGRPMPLDAEPTPSGNTVLVGDDYAETLAKGDARWNSDARYRSHFATCPQGRAWQGRRR